VVRRLPALSWDLRDSADRSACPVGGPPGADAFQSCLAPAVRLPESFPGRIAPTALERTRSPAGIRAAYAVVTREHRIGVRLRAGVRRGGLLSDRAGGESGLPVQQQEGPRPEQHPRDRPGEPVVVGPGRSATSLLPGAPDDGNPSDEAAPQRIGRRVRPSAGPDLAVEAGRVPLDGVNGDPEAAGDLRGQVRGASRHGDLAISRTGCVRSARRLGPQPRHAVCGRPLPPHPSSRRIARRVRRDRSHERQGVR
jgi:hypothetical protein